MKRSTLASVGVATALAILEDHSFAGRALQYGFEEFRAQEVKVDLALPEHVQIERVVVVQHVSAAKTIVTARHRGNIDWKIRARAQLAPDVLAARSR